MSRVPWWAVLSAGGAPVLLIGGWTLAADRQPPGYDPTVETISSLAALDATDRWLMTAALVGVGLCHLVTALGLRPAAPGGRLLLAGGGVATLLVAAFPLPGSSGGSTAHTVAASLAFGLLAVWPAVAFRRAGGTPWPLRPAVAAAATVVLVALVGWFVVALRDETAVGLAERVAAGAQALWPLVAVLGVRRDQGHVHESR